MKMVIFNKRENMRKVASALLVIVFVSGLIKGCGNNAIEQDSMNKVKRVGMVIKVKPEYIEEYKALHVSSNPGVRDLLTKANMHNFSIFLHQFDDGNWYEFGYYEYTGNDFEADMEELSKHPRNIEWLKVCDPMQVPLDGYEGWAEMEQVYYNK
tara:strand:+ start:22 stop:483 length:462 start_codon:yes stop_codon:yes gene_type:complete